MEKKEDNEKSDQNRAARIELKKLIGYVDFIVQQDLMTEGEMESAIKIKKWLQHTGGAATIDFWVASLSLVDDDIINGRDEGVFARRWELIFEDNVLVMEAGTYHTGDDSGGYGTDPNIFGKAEFPIGSGLIEPQLDQIDLFLEDVMIYRSYITESLNHIEVEICL